ncbi:DUF2889 domain-containing protein [Nocardioides sp. cx-169]|uniref:DUF2889 domain-containing protein n=1 Tax=Nocardioides sp. cx-169 TaxID=2899080 RepID=UPI001E5AD28A|nr:DUF2889 domain-containing protein [Nocardioides sp. cx-169]MCD4533019.1 DUF2889 domain-containing protein [Nocardioides sp. cx-169]
MADAVGLPVPRSLAPTGPVPSAAGRAPGSIRRTSTIDASWPGGIGADTVLEGRARDLVTTSGAEAEVLAEASLAITVRTDRTIGSVASTPARPELAGLVGAPTGRGYRARLAETAPAEVAASSPLHLLLDDVPGAALVSGVAHRRWHDPDELLVHGHLPGTRVVRGLCTGFQDGSSGLAPDGTSNPSYRTSRVQPVDALADELAWHRLPALPGMTMRRARRLDVRVEGGSILMDAFFQDSCMVPDGGRKAVHEYTLTAVADLADGTLRELAPVARVLPHHECPLAIGHAEGVVGLPLAQLRPRVLKQLRSTAGCTHLNDLIRSLADVPTLVERLGGAKEVGR